MEGHSHDPVSGVESFLHTIAMVDVYVNVQYPLVVPGREGDGEREKESNTFMVSRKKIQY